MKKIFCEICDSTRIRKETDFFVCQDCGAEYSLLAARGLLREEEKTPAKTKKEPNYTEEDDDKSHYYGDIDVLEVYSDVDVKVLNSATAYTEVLIHNISTDLFDELSHSFIEDDGIITMKVVARLKKNIYNIPNDACLGVYIRNQDLALASANIETVSGDIYCEFPTMDVILKSMSGDIHFTEGVSTLYVNSISGDINMTLDTDEDYPFVEADEIQTVSGDVHIKIDSTARFINHISTISGDINDNYRAPRSANVEREMNIRTVSGDITIE